METTVTSFLEGSFSIIVAAFLLLRMESRMSELTNAINLLRHCQNCKYSPYNNHKPTPDADIDYKNLPVFWDKE